MAQWLVYHLLGMNPEDHLAKALDFFIYDSIKILLLLFTVVFLMGTINSYFPIDRVKNYLSRNKLYGVEYFMASLFGVVTPFCSCSSVPLFIGFVRGGIPLGVTFAFLVTSPLVNEVAIGNHSWIDTTKIEVGKVSYPMGKRGSGQCTKRSRKV